MATPFPRGMNIRQGPSFRDFQSMQMAPQPGVGEDIANIAAFGANEIEGYNDRQAMLEKMVYKRQEAAQLQQAKEDWLRKDAEFAQAKADEDTRQFDARESRANQKFTADESEKDRLATIAAAKVVQSQKNVDAAAGRETKRDESLASYRIGTLAKQRAGSSKTIYPSHDKEPGNTRRILKNIERGVINDTDALKMAERRLERLNTERDKIEAEELKTGRGTEGKNLGKSDFFDITNWGDVYEGDDNKGLATQKRRIDKNQKRLKNLDTEILDYEGLVGILSPGENVDLGDPNESYNPNTAAPTGTPNVAGVKSIEGDYSPSKGKFSAPYIDQVRQWMMDNPDDPRYAAAEEKLAELESQGVR